MIRLERLLVIVVMMVVVAAGPLGARAGSWRMAVSDDGVPIAYMVKGKGAVTLVFVHGWNCDSRYWQEQVGHFAKRYQVVTVDLAGHGHSGAGRTDYTMQAFGQDVKAVVEALGAERVILIGHSMSGIVIAEAAALMPGRVVGIIGVDTLQNVEGSVTQQQLDGFVAAFRNDFAATVRPFVGSMFVKDTDPAQVAWITEDMAAAPPAVAVSAFREMMSMYVGGDVAKLFAGLNVPVRCVNADLWPAFPEVNRRHIRSFEMKTMKGRGHFLMLERPAEFNKLLEGTVRELTARK